MFVISNLNESFWKTKSECLYFISNSTIKITDNIESRCSISFFDPFSAIATDGQHHSRIYDIYFLIFSSTCNMQSATSHSIYISQMIHYAPLCLNYTDLISNGVIFLHEICCNKIFGKLTEINTR